MYFKKTHIHFIGIGGIGMSGIAKILLQKGYHISGCDNDCTQKSVFDLKNLGCSIYEGNNTFSCNDKSIKLIVHSSDIKSDHPELLKAAQQGIPFISRGIMLAELTRTKYTVAIAGSHGKTTTTSLISHIFIQAHMDPTVIIGGHLHSISSNATHGDGDFLITETDESDRSLLHLYPTIAILTNIDREHLNTYENIHDLTETFYRFLKKVPFYGKAFLCVDDPHICALLPLFKIPTSTYGSSPEAEWSFKNATLESDHSTYTLMHKQVEVGFVKISMPGIHNILNSIAALAASLEAGISFDIASQALATFSGVDRRFTLRGTFQGAQIFDDYGHHPTEINCTVAVARKKTAQKLIMIFQPHRYTRMNTLWKDFIQFFATVAVDHIIITDLYSAHETPLAGISSLELVKQVKNINPEAPITYVPLETDFSSLKTILSSSVVDGDLILLQGAGNINRIVPHLLS